jgi:hypothetical protein
VVSLARLVGEVAETKQITSYRALRVNGTVYLVLDCRKKVEPSQTDEQSERVSVFGQSINGMECLGDSFKGKYLA